MCLPHLGAVALQCQTVRWHSSSFFLPHVRDTEDVALKRVYSITAAFQSLFSLSTCRCTVDETSSVVIRVWLSGWPHGPAEAYAASVTELEQASMWTVCRVRRRTSTVEVPRYHTMMGRRKVWLVLLVHLSQPRTWAISSLRAKATFCGVRFHGLGVCTSLTILE